MKIKSLRKYSPGYQFLRYFVSSYLKIFYRRIYIKGKENIPEDVPVIFAPNHQNALMDALAIVCTIKKQPVFLARSDIFKTPLQIAALRFLRILPVYRMRDGYGTLKENDEVFDNVIKHLQNCGVIGIMPEGTHGEKKMLRSLKKGIFRMAFQAEQNSGFDLNLKIVPVGLEFDSCTSFRASLFINFGKPIDFKHLFPLYRENPQLALNQAKDYFADNLRALMIDIRNEENHTLFLKLWSLTGNKLEGFFNTCRNKIHRRFMGGKALSEAINKFNHENPEFLKNLDRKTEKLEEILQLNKIKPGTIAIKPEHPVKLCLKFIGLLFLFPMWVYGMVNNLIPWAVIRSKVKSIKDPQFISSFKFVLSLFLFPIFYFLQFLTAGFLLGFVIALLYLLSLPVTGYVAWAYLKWWKKLLAEFSYNRLYRNGKINEALQLRDEIFNDLNTLLPDSKTAKG